MAEFVDVMKKYKEMCDYYGYCSEECPLMMLKDEYKFDCTRVLKYHPEEAEAVIMSWAKPVDWSKVEVDTKILVSCTEHGFWDRRHFAKYENGKVYAWANGKTSFSSQNDNDNITHWEFAKLAEEGE